MHHCLKMAGVQPDEPAEVQVEDTLFSAGGPAPSELGATQRDEEKVRVEAQKDEDVQFRFNISDDDILPTGSGAGAMTALVTHIFLDPSARHLQLRLKYKERAHVETPNDPTPAASGVIDARAALEDKMRARLNKRRIKSGM